MHKNIPEIVKLITGEIKTRADKVEKWASLKRENEGELRRLLELDHTDMKNPGSLLGFDIDDENQLILLNYTGQAHNELHDVEGGWTQPLRDMRGLVYSFAGEEPQLVSRGFEKFFNANELPENTYTALREKYGNKRYLAREKADGHMIEYFMHNGQLHATTRGKFNTASAVLALEMLGRSGFEYVNEILGGDLMTIVVELIHPNTEVHVDYDGQETLCLLAAFNTSGNKFPVSALQLVSSMVNEFTIPNERRLTLDEMINEINDRGVTNNEGWVMDFDGELIKFKYIDYIGQMVKSKLSYKYIMNCIRNDRLDRMLHTLPEEIREHAYDMVSTVWEVADEAFASQDHKVLYNLYGELEGGREYFRTCCRAFYREIVLKE
jgi:hypothetical protein